MATSTAPNEDDDIEYTDSESDSDDVDEFDFSEFEDEDQSFVVQDDGMTIGDVESRLNSNKLLYNVRNVDVKNENDDLHLSQTLTDQLFAFSKSLHKQIKTEFEAETGRKWHPKDAMGLHKRRICIVVDRRIPTDYHNEEESKEPDVIFDTCRVFLFSPPSNCNRVADVHPAIPESYFSASKTCMLPKDTENEAPAINVTMPLAGFQFTLSFHVAAADDIKCYLFRDGQMSRFFPQDMVDLWHIWFVKDYGPFRGDQDTWNLVNKIQAMLRDDDFVAWFGETTGNEFGPLLKTYRVSDSNRKEQ